MHAPAYAQHRLVSHNAPAGSTAGSGPNPTRAASAAERLKSLRHAKIFPDALPVQAQPQPQAEPPRGPVETNTSSPSDAGDTVAPLASDNPLPPPIERDPAPQSADGSPPLQPLDTAPAAADAGSAGSSVQPAPAEADSSTPTTASQAESAESEGSTPTTARQAEPAESEGSTPAAAGQADPAQVEASTPTVAGPEVAAEDEPADAIDISGERLPSVLTNRDTEASDTWTPSGSGFASEHDEPAGIEPEATAGTPLEPSPGGQQDAELKAEGLLFTNRSPSLTVETAGPRTIVVGKAATYAVRMRNSGGADAEDVVVTVGIPAWADVIETEATLGSARFQADDPDTAAVKWHVPRLSSHDSQQLLLKLIPRDSRPFDLSVGWTSTPTRSLTQIEVQEPKLEMSVIGPQEVLYGETKVYTIAIRNPGTGAAENVVLQLLPIVPDEKVVGVREIGLIEAGGRKVIEVELAARQSGKLQVRARAMAEGGLSAEAAQDVIVRRANLEVNVEGPPMKYAGTAATYLIHVANTGDATARDILATAMLPAGAKFVAATGSGRFDDGQGAVQWPVGILRPGTERVLQLDCMLISPGQNRLEVRSHAEGELTAAQSVMTNVEALADLKLLVNDPPGAVAVGSDSVYEVRVVNRGTKAAENVRIVGYFSEGLEPFEVQGWKGEAEPGQVVLEPIARLGAGQEIALKIAARADRPGNHVFRAELECVDPETRLAAEEWTHFYGSAQPVLQAARDPASAEPIDLQR